MSIFTAKYTENMKAIYIWQQKDWPNFIWDNTQLSYKLGNVRNLQGKLVGKMSMLGFDLQNNAILDTLTADITKSSEIEGEILNSDQVRSSVARQSRNRNRRIARSRSLRGWGGSTDDRCNSKLRTTVNKRTSLQLACGTVSNRQKRGI